MKTLAFFILILLPTYLVSQTITVTKKTETFTEFVYEKIDGKNYVVFPDGRKFLTEIPDTVQSISNQQLREIERYFVTYLNEYRKTKGLDTLIYDANVSKWSENQSEYLAKLNAQSLTVSDIYHWGHCQDIQIKDFIGTNRKKPPFLCNENIAVSITSTYKNCSSQEWAKIFLDLWINSPGHNKNLLFKEGKKIGINFYYIEFYNRHHKEVGVLAGTMNETP